MSKLLDWFKGTAARRLEELRHSLAGREALLPLAVLGIAAGVVAGGVIVAFRLMIETPQSALFGPDDLENYEALAPWLRFALPAAGGLLVGVIFQRLAAADRQIGVVHVMEGLAYKEGHLPIKNAGVQFLGAGLCLVAGHSVGREGPSIHIGAACGSWMGQRLHFPNNSIRVLVGCGTAGAIAAAFNTPLAGVVFAMEVVLVEYVLADFTPIILAAVSATAVSRWVFGADPVFDVPEAWLGSLGDLYYIVAMGVAIGALSAAFVHLLIFFSHRLTEWPIWQRMTIAGIATGLLAMPLPQIMGIGYDTVNATLGDASLAGLGLGLVLAVLAGKLLATAIGLGLGLPGGLIGPTLVMGAAAGAASGLIIDALAPGNTSAPAFYAMLGMGAMMGATLNAPLAALTALLELTANPHVILPGMLAIVAAGITSHQIFNTPSVFLKLMQRRGLDYHSDPVSQLLRRLGVARSMERKVLPLPRRVEAARLNTALAAQPVWLAVEAAGERRQLIFAEALGRCLEKEDIEGGACFDLARFPVTAIEALPISTQSSLLGALRKMNQEEVEALYVIPRHGERILGVITRKTIEDVYRYPRGRPGKS